MLDAQVHSGVETGSINPGLPTRDDSLHAKMWGQ
jgi:hypothetical protein